MTNFKIQKIINSFILFFLIGSSIFLLEVKANDESVDLSNKLFSFTVITNFLSGPEKLVEYWAEELLKIGIFVDDTVLLIWHDIHERTYLHESPIPGYDEGGYDMLETALTFSEPEWFPGMYFSNQLMPLSGFNINQFNNSEYEQKLAEFYQTYYSNQKISYIEEMQEILNDELPQIPLVYENFYGVMHENITGIDTELLDLQMQQFDLVKFGDNDTLRIGIHPPLYSYFVPPQIQHFEFPDKLIQNQIWNGLLIRENGTKIWKERIANNYSTSDGLNWFFDIDPNAKFADGTKVTADDVIFSYQVILDPELSSYHYSTYSSLLDNESIIKIDEDTIKFELNYITSYPERLFEFGILPKHIWENVPLNNWSLQSSFWALNYPEKLFGAGPYKLALYNPNNGTILLTDNSYFDQMENCQTQHLKNLYFLMDIWSGRFIESNFANGLIDMIDPHYVIDDIIDAATFPNSKYYKVQFGFIYSLFLNMNNPYFGTGELCPIAGKESAKYVRKAMNCLKPKSKFESIEELTNIEMAPSFLPKYMLGYNENIKAEEYNLTKAKEFMRLAGFNLPGDKGFIGLNIYIFLGVISLISINIVRYRRKRVN